MTPNGRTGTALLALVAALGVQGPVVAAATVDYPAPGLLPAAHAHTLTARYLATSRLVEQARDIALDGGDHPRADALSALLGRDLLDFDPRGNGRVVEVVGDLSNADRIAVMVPGSHTRLDTFSDRRGPGGGAHALAEQIADDNPQAQVAVVAWLGYDTPQGASPQVATDRLARTGAEALRDTVETLRQIRPTAQISLLCHSYGSVVCAYAAPDLTVTDLVIYGSPGVGARTATDLDTTARIWAGRANRDWIRFVPSVRVAGIGFGADPVSPGFGALPFDAGGGAHGDYHLAGQVSLVSLAAIVLGAGEPHHA